MWQRRWPLPILFVLMTGLVGVGASPSAVDRISGLITRTYVIVEDTELAGDVTCDVTGAACFSFGASDVSLRLNGFSITGKADPVTACGGGPLTAAEAGILTNGQNNVTVQGPGLVQRFRLHGVFVGGSRGVRVDSITASTNCGSGVFIAANSFDTLVEGIVSVRNGATAPGAACGGV
jgi:hypothetical protein